MIDSSDLIREGLRVPPLAVGYSLNERICASFPNKYVMRTRDLSFDLDTWIERTNASVIVRDSPLPEWDSRWEGPGRTVCRRLSQGHRSVSWDGSMFDVIEVSWEQGFHTQTTMWWIGHSRETVEGFASHVAEVANELVDEVLVFASGCWQRSPRLHKAIRGTTFETLVLPPGRVEVILADFRGFLGAREEYERFGVPWKRGALLVGPPGNGKTHCVKALLNAFRLPCLYVQSFEAQGGDSQANVRAVFERARRSTPCALVLEDLDSLLTPTTRSFFLNELDGFAENAGIVTIATTNHPERLDPAIVDRPSRFDRKYNFELPGPDERRAYLEHWRARLEPRAAPLGDATLESVAAQTDGFSYAYLKELVLSTLVAWMTVGRTDTLDETMSAQVSPLRDQLESARELLDARARYVPEGGGMYAEMLAARRRDE